MDYTRIVMDIIQIILSIITIGILLQIRKKDKEK